MAAKNPRIPVSLDPIDYEIVQIISKRNGTSLSQTLKNLLKERLEELEEIALMKKVMEREAKNNPLISHEEFWGNK